MEGRRELLAYLAGAMDADGYFSIWRRVINARRAKIGVPYHVAKVGLNEIHDVIPRLLLDTFGGKVYDCKNRKRNHFFMWCVSGKLAATTSEELLPFLRLKQRQAEIVVEMRSFYTGRRTDRLTPGRLAGRERLYAEIRGLNSPRNPKYVAESAAPRTEMGTTLDGETVRHYPTPRRVELALF